MDLQELITRGRFVMGNAPARQEVFRLVNGRRTARDIAAETKRPMNAVSNDLRTLLDAELVRPRTGPSGAGVQKDGAAVLEKVPLARTVKLSLFQGTSKRPSEASPPRKAAASRKQARAKAVPVPTEGELLEICSSGEDQLNEFKGQGTEARKIAKEVAAMLTTKDGGLILYGVDDDGTIQGSDLSRAKLDQSVQNAVRNSIRPAPHVTLHTVRALVSDVIVIGVPPWNRVEVFQYEGRVYTRKGTNVFEVTTDEASKLHRGEYIN